MKSEVSVPYGGWPPILDRIVNVGDDASHPESANLMGPKVELSEWW
jgi:hypothetical protein